MLRSSTSTRTTCAYCGVGCGMRVAANEFGKFEIQGDPDHPANYGRLCAKGAALIETMDFDARIHYPEIGGQRSSWDTALSLIATRFEEVIAKHGPDAVAFYVSGQLLTEDYYVANKLMKGFIGSANIDTNSRLCMASSVAGHKRAFGEDVVPGVYTDLELADVVVLVGSNLAWCHPVLHQRLLAAREERGTKIIVIDPRATATSADADLHLALSPGSDIALFNGLLRYLAVTNAIDRPYIAAHTSGFREALGVAMDFDPPRVMRDTGLTSAKLHSFYTLFRDHSHTVTVYSQGVNQSQVGTDKVNAIINCHLATGRVGKAGSGPFSVTGQPNAMGGRETGGLANMLAAHLDIDDVSHRATVQKFWSSPRLPKKPGLKAVDLFKAVDDGRIKALWIMATNPAASMPDADVVADAIARCPFVVVSDITRNADTVELADVVLPAAAWGEKDGTVTNSERRISRQRAFTKPPGEARPDWWALAAVGQRMGYTDAFNYEGPHAIYREHARLTELAQRHGRKLDLRCDRDIDETTYNGLAPRTWPLGDDGRRERRLFGDGIFATNDGYARFIPVGESDSIVELKSVDSVVMNTGRIRDQWHTMTRSARAGNLAAHTAEPQVDLHPETARKFGIDAAELAYVYHGDRSLIARVTITEKQSPNSIYVPMHWTAHCASRARVNALISSRTDPISGQPDLKSARVQIRRYPAQWYGFGLFEKKPCTPAVDYWALMRAPNGWRLELANAEAASDPAGLFTELAGESVDNVQILEFTDRKRQSNRFVALKEGRLFAALFIAPEPVSVRRNWAAERIGQSLEQDEHVAVLAGFPSAKDSAQLGELVCVCHRVTSAEISSKIQTGASSVSAIGAQTKAGTHCGSCRGDIQKLIAETQSEPVATA